jgi:hypothetical protein
MTHAPSVNFLLFTTPQEPDRNYEVLDTYVFSDCDREAVKKAASLHSGVDENLAWLHLYFDEVIWPASERQKAHVSKFAAAAVQTRGGEGSDRKKYFMCIDGLDPKGKEAWVQASVKKAAAFARSSSADLCTTF